MELENQFEHPEQFSLCLRVRERLPDYVEGYLDALAAEAIRAHLAVCYLCKREYDEMLQTIRLVETLPFVEPARDYAPSIMAAIEEIAPPGYSFQAPVVEMEMEALTGFNPAQLISEPRSITGRKRQFHLPALGRRFGIGERSRDGLTRVSPEDLEKLAVFPSLRERVMTALALSSVLLSLLLHPWSKAALAAPAAVGPWLERASEFVSHLPAVGFVLSFAAGAVTWSGQVVGSLLGASGRVPSPVLVVEGCIAAGLGCYALARIARAASHSARL